MIERFDEREIAAVMGVIRSGKLSQFFLDFKGGPNVQEFEKEFAEYVGAKYAVSVNNGTVALEIALKALGVGKGDEIITTPLSFCATATAILAVGATPVFVDITHNLTLNRHDVKKAVSDKTKAIIPVSLLGYPTDIPHIQKPKTAELNNIPVIEDAAQCLGSSVAEQKIGSRATLSTFSLQESKQITSLGEGGIITTNDEVLADVCCHLRNHGNSYGDQIADFVCSNYRMAEAQAAFGRVQLQKLDEINENIIENAEYFMEEVRTSDIGEMMRPVYNNIPNIYKPTYLLVPFLLHDNINRDHLLGYLGAKGISKGIPGQNVGYYKQLIYDLPIFQEYHPRKSRLFHRLPQCPTAEYLIKKLILFDIHRWQDKTLIDKCVKALENYTR